MENLTANAEKRKQPEESSSVAVDTGVKNQDSASKRQRVEAWKYDVFVSFRGEDIRKGFIDHLFTDFKRNGIYAFRDNIDLPRGEQISPQLYKAIESSRFLVVIFSKNYAASSWCLRELVKILNSKQMENPKHEVRILFYDVKPEVVRKQTGSYAEAFSEHEVSNRAEVDEWRRALVMAASLAGRDLNDTTNGYESRFIDHISKEICKALYDGPLHVGENLVGVHARMNKLNLMRFRRSNKVNMIGICGISGIGKTTLAKAIYNSMYTYFEGSCFCEDVAKRQDLTQVQTQLINKILKSGDVKIHGKSEGVEIIKRRVGREPVLVGLDDVDHREQLEALAGSHHWFCPGSMIILTAKDKQLLTSHGADEIYEMEFLDAREDIELFCLHAFHQTFPANDFEHLACQAVKYLQGHPLALKVVGSALFGSCERIWRSELDRLQKHPNSEIQQKLRPSFDLLDFDQKRIFLDIAFFLIGENLEFCASVLSSDCSADANINVLVNKSLVTISPDGSLLMHELIRSMARQVLREEPYRPTRLCGLSQVYAVLGEKNVTQTTKAVEVLVLLLEKSTKTVHIDCEAFSKMEKLRILKFCRPEPKDFEESFQSPVNFSGRLGFLSNELRLMYWHGYPFKSLPSDFYPENVFAIDLSYSNIESFWTTPKSFERLKVMKLRHCRNLTTTPDFTEMTNLEKLIFEGCVNLVKLHPSIGILKKLVMLNMRGCTNIRSIPRKVELDSLQVLILPGCFKTDIPTQVLSTLKSLVKPNADETAAITGFSSFISSLTNLQVLEINGQQSESPTWCKSIFQKQPQSFVLPSLASLRLLTKLNLRNCNISEVCDDIGTLSCLTHLYLDHNNFTKLPESLGELSCLETLYLTGCEKLEVIPKYPPHLQRLYASQCTSLQELPRQFPRRNNFNCFCADCPKITGNVTIDSQVSVSQKNYRFMEFLGIESRVREFFSGSGGFSSTERELDMVLRGNRRIPEWYTNRSKGNHVKVELPPHWCYSKFKGYALCALFTVKPHTIFRPGCLVENFNGTSLPRGTYGGWGRNRGSHDTTRIWWYFSTRIRGWEEANHFLTFTFYDDRKEGDGMDFQEVGVRLVCEAEEDEDIIQLLPPLITSQRPNYNCRFFFKDGEDHIRVYW